MDTQELQVSLPWGIIRGKAWGDPNSIPIIGIHGIQDNCCSFDNLIPLLPQRGFYYICIDLPGHGRSSHFPEGLYFSVITYIETVKRIIDGLKLKKCIYMGHSLGGHIGIFLASAFPEIISKLILIDVVFSEVLSTDTLHITLGRKINALLDLENRLISKAPPDYTYDEAVQRMITSRPTPITEKGAKTLAKRSLIKNIVGFRYSSDQRLRLSVGNYFSLKQQKNFIDNIKQPVIIIVAHDSFELPECKDIKKTQTILFKDLKDSKHCIIKTIEGNHNVHIDYPERVAPLISRFLLSERSSL